MMAKRDKLTKNVSFETGANQLHSGSRHKRLFRCHRAGGSAAEMSPETPLTPFIRRKADDRSSRPARKRERLFYGNPAAAPESGQATLPLELFRDRKLAFNEHRSMSGYLALKRDLEAMGTGFGLFGDVVATGAHRASVIAVADGKADFAAIDCKSWRLAERYEPAAKELHVVGWTARRKGCPSSAPGGSISIF